MVNPINAHGPLVHAHTHAYEAGKPAPTDDGAARLEAPAPTVGEDDTEQRGARGNKHGGPPGQLAKELLGDQSQ